MTGPSATATPRAQRLRAPLLVALWALLAFESAGGLVIFVARLVTGALPGEALHVLAGAALAGAYAVYQWQHWGRVSPFRARLDYAMGLLASIGLALTLLTGFALAVPWWRVRVVAHSGGTVDYPAWVSGTHLAFTMLALTFVGAHLGAVLLRDARRR